MFSHTDDLSRVVKLKFEDFDGVIFVNFGALMCFGCRREDFILSVHVL